MIPGIKIIKKIRAHTGCSNWTGWSQLNCSFWKNKLKFHCRTVKFRSRLFIRVEWNTMEFKKAWPWISFYGVEPFEPFRTISNSLYKNVIRGLFCTLQTIWFYTWNMELMWPSINERPAELLSIRLTFRISFILLTCAHIILKINENVYIYYWVRLLL